MNGNSRKNKGTRIILIAFVAVALSACSMDVDTYAVTKQKVELHSESHSARVTTGSLDRAGLMSLADHYSHYGDGPVEITVLYDPASRINTAMNAANEADRIAAFLKRKGVAQVNADTLPISGQGDVSETLVSYDMFTAHAPSECVTSGGLDGRQTAADEEYIHGCNIETALSRQIANPRDLAGREGLGAAGSGRRQANVVEGYKTGIPNSDLEGETASE